MYNTQGWWFLISFLVWLHDFTTDFERLQSHAYEILAVSDALRYILYLHPTVHNGNIAVGIEYRVYR